jgi:1-acyl-sn-glycerol-3-phosphate acyltransferase
LSTGVGQVRGSAVARWILKRLGWRLLEVELPEPKGIIVAYPHTSNWDFPLAMLAKWALGWPVRFWGKDTLFRWPLFGRWLRWIGGVPVHRHSPQGLVSDTRRAMDEADCFWLALSPEGTRKASAGWRMGFHHLWSATGVPLGVAVLDWGRKEIGVRAFLRPSGDTSRDFLNIRTAIAGATGHTPGHASPVQPWVRSDGASNARNKGQECR